MQANKRQGRASRSVHALSGLPVALFLAFSSAAGAASAAGTSLPLSPASVLPLHVGGLFGTSASDDESPAPATTTASDLRPAAAPRVEQTVINPLEALSSYVPGPGEWRQVPGLQFNRFGLTDQEATALNIRGTAGSAAVLSQQTGSAYDPEGFLWYFWGGGGGSYGGNEVYRLDLTFPLISQITQPSTLDTTVTDLGANNCVAPSDGPAAGSTYDGFVWSPATQSFFVFPTGGFCPGGTYNQKTVWEFDPLAGTWDSIAGMTSLTGPVFAEHDPVSGLIYVVEAGANATVREFDPVTGQLGPQNNLGQSLSDGNAVLDSSNDELIVFAQEGVYAVSLVNLGSIRRLADVPSGYDTASGAALDSGRRLVALWAGGKTVHSFDLATYTWTEEIPASGPNAGPGGVFSKWIAIPEFGIFAGYHNPGEGLWLYRLPTSLNVPPPPNRAPVAFAGGAIVTAHTGNAVDLNGSGSTDPDGDALSFAWSTVSSPAGNTPVLSTPNQAATSFTPAVNGGYVLRLTVSDGVLSDTVNVTVTATNTVPVANAGPDQPVQVGQTATLNAGASTDADGDTLSYSWSIAAAPSGSSAALSGAQSVSPSFVPDQAGTYRLSVNVSDGIASAQGTVVVTASVAPPANSAPVANAGPDQSLIEGQTAALTGLASSDPDGDTLSYTWTLTQKPAGSTANLSNASAAQPSLALDVAGAYVASLTADDGALTSAADQVTITAQIDLGTAGGDPVLLAHWEFDEGSGTLVTDSAGNNFGTVNGAAYAIGVTGMALDFDGADDHVVINTSANLDIAGNAITLAAWIRPDNTGDSAGSRIISKRTDSGGSDVYALFSLSGNIWFRIRTGGVERNLIYGGSVIPGRWQHLAGVYDGSMLKLYVNGQEVASQNHSGNLDRSTRPVYIGQREAEQRNFDGSIDDVRIYNLALTASEAQALYNVAAGNLPPPQPTIAFSASSGNVTSGQSSTLSWSSQDATACQAAGDWSGAKATVGNQSVTPTAPATYTLTCTGAGGSASKSVSVFVSSGSPGSGGGGSLAQLAGSMQAGTWAELSTNGIGALMAQVVGGDFIEYSDEASWDPVSRQLFIYGTAHHVNYENGLVAYSEATNSWRLLSEPYSGAQTVHGYDHQAINPNTGKFYFRLFNSKTVAEYDIQSGAWGTLPTINASVTCCAALEYFPELNGLIYSDGPNVHLFDFSTRQWARIASNVYAGSGNYHNISEYSAAHKVMFLGGGNTASRAVHVLDSSGRVTRKNDAPVSLIVSLSTVTVDPISGNFLVLSGDGAFYEYNPISDSWRSLGGTPLAPKGLENNNVATPISNYGVTMFVARRKGDNQPKVYLYKHSQGTGTPAPTPLPLDATAPTVSITQPAAQTTVSGTASVAMSANDNVGVTKIEFYVDGALKGSDAQSPFAFAWDTTNGGTHTCTGSHTHTLTARAYDAAGNVGTSAGVAVNMNEPSYCSSAPPTGPVGSGIGGFDMPSLQDEKDTYVSWNWTWPSNKEPNFPGDSSYRVGNPGNHNDTEGDDLWTYLMMYRRTGQQGYLDRASAWKDYFMRQRSASGYSFDLNGFGGDHIYGWGLVAWYEHTGDIAALDEAENLAAVVETLWGPNSSFGCLPSGGCMWYGLRQVSRHLHFITKVAEATGKQRWITLRDQILNTVMTSGQWDNTRGMYFYGSGSTDGDVGSGAYAAGARVQSAFQIGVLTEALAQAYRVTGRQDIRNRMIAMARFVDQYGLDPNYAYTGSVFGIVNGSVWHNYGSGGTATFWDPAYTTSLVNTLVWGYKLTGDLQLLDRARTFFNRGTKGIYGSSTQRSAADNVVAHFADTVFDSSTGNFYLSFNKGELQYTYMIFENGGLPTVVGSSN